MQNNSKGTPSMNDGSVNGGFNTSLRRMPSLNMNSPSAPNEMPDSDIDASSGGNMQKVLVEMRVPSNQGVLAASRTAAQINVSSFAIDCNCRASSSDGLPFRALVLLLELLF